MGVLDIRGRSERLGNIASIQRAVTDDGSQNRARMEMAAAEMVGRSNMEIGRSIASLGEGVRGLFKTGVEIYKKEDERKFNKYYTEMSKLKNESYVGKTDQDGWHPGLLNQEMENPQQGRTIKSWIADGQKADDKNRAAAIKAAGISEEDAARYDADKRMVTWRQDWDSRINAAVATQNDRSCQDTADGALRTAVGEAVGSGTARSANNVLLAARESAKTHHLYSEAQQRPTVMKAMDEVENGILKNVCKTFQSEEAWDDAIQKAKDGNFYDAEFNGVLGEAYGWAEEKKAAIENGRKDHDPAKAHGAKIAEALTKAKAQWVRQAEAQAKAVQDAEMKANEEDFSKTVLESFKPDAMPVNVDEKIAAIRANPRMTDSTKLKCIDTWTKWQSGMKKDEDDRKEKHGYEETIVLPDKKEVKVWINAARFGQDDERITGKMTPLDIKRDPVGTILELEALKATGNVSESTYKDKIGMAMAFRDENTVKAVERVMGGKLLKIIDTKTPGKKDNTWYDTNAVGETELYYKRKQDAGRGYQGTFAPKTGWYGKDTASMQWKQSVYDDMKSKSAGEQLFTPEEKMSLIGEIKWMSDHGYTDQQIDSAVEEIIAPKATEFFRMTMEQRLSNQEFLNTIRTMGDYDERLNARVSALNGDRRVDAVRDSVNPAQIKRNQKSEKTAK